VSSDSAAPRFGGPRHTVARLVPPRARPWVAIAAAMAWAEIRRDGSRNFAGLLWWLADPLVNLVIYFFVFTYVFKTTTPHFLAFLMLNLMVWRWLAVTLTQSAYSILTGVNLLRQVYLPKAILPLKFLMTESLAFSIGLVLVFIVVFGSGVHPHKTLVLLPPLIVLTLFHTYAVSLIAAFVSPYVPDTVNILNFALRGLSMISGIFFEPESLGPTAARLLYLNPWACLLDAWRSVIIKGVVPNKPHLLYVTVLSIALAWAGVRLHRRLDRSVTKALR
jgi:ABC-type polysaccharide/polyol phosphate export permease